MGYCKICGKKFSGSVVSHAKTHRRPGHYINSFIEPNLYG